MKPILFNTEMVRAILAGRKTVTRRVVKPQPRGHAALLGENILPETEEAGAGRVYAFEDGTVTSSPYRPGDILYVQEMWQYRRSGGYLYRSINDVEYPLNWYSPINMPKDAARLFLRVTWVRVERLRGITEAQALAEGCTTHGGNLAIDEFASVWDSTVPTHPNKFKRYLYYWADNPWVWVIEFERISKEEAEE